MIFTLEALQADHGDSLLLHYGTEETPKLVLIDGGPDGVYRASLRKRLEQLRNQRGNARLPLEVVMVSHIDRDHITGILALTGELLEKKEAREPVPYRIARLWHNSFDDFINTDDAVWDSAVATAIAASAADGPFPLDVRVEPTNVAIVADVKQGRNLRDHAVRLSLAVNAPFQNIVMAPAVGKKTVALSGGLKLTVVAPNEARVEALQEDWDNTLRRLKLAKDAERAAIAAAYLDKSIPNLSSIVVLAEANGKSMLLTGDARGDDVVAGLRSAGLLVNGNLHVDLLKLPHHGSDRNVSTNFFRTVTADHYVVSGDGKNGNPDIPALKMISEARGQDKFTIHLTNREKRLETFFEEEKGKGKKYKAIFRKSNALSISVKLGS